MAVPTNASMFEKNEGKVLLLRYNSMSNKYSFGLYENHLLEFSCIRLGWKTIIKDLPKLSDIPISLFQVKIRPSKPEGSKSRQHFDELHRNCHIKS